MDFGLANTIMAAMLPIAGIAMSWWSFRWGELGATPDSWSMESPQGREVEMFEKGERFRARWWAKACFNAGALLLTASVPIGQATDHIRYAAILAAAGYAIVLFDVGYFGTQVWNIWQSLRADAFAIYFQPMMWQLYDKERTAQIYYSHNPMPFWLLFDRDWLAKRKIPDIHEVYAKASLTRPPQTDVVRKPD